MNQLPPELIDTIITGDNVDVMKRLIPDESISLTVTSPPYDNLRDYEGHAWDFEAVAAELWRVTKPGGVVVWVVGDATVNGSETGTSFRQALHFMGLGFNMETMVYEQAGTGAKGSNNLYWQGFEFMFVFGKGATKARHRIADRQNLWAGQVTGYENKVSRTGTRNERGKRVTPQFSVRTNIWRYQVGNNGDDLTDHPAPFPEDLAQDHILSWSSPGDIVLDCFAGSGTTCKQCVLLDRRFIGIEISEKYAAIARERVRRVQIQPKLIPFQATEWSAIP